MLKIGIVGTNTISDRFAEAAAATDHVTVTAVYSRIAQKGAAFSDRHAIPQFFTDYETFLSSDIDAVYIASPNMCHAAQTIAAAARKKHILCEKPLAPTRVEAEAMCRAANENGVVLLEAMRPVFVPAMTAAKDALGKIGTLRYAHFDFCQYSSRYNRFLSGEILNAFDPALGNAAVLDIGIYPLSIMLYLLGNPEKIVGRSVILSNGFEGRGSLLCSYPGMTATVNYSKIENSALPTVIVGEHGYIEIDKANAPKRITLTVDGQCNAVITDDAENNMCYEIEAFRDMILGRRSPLPYTERSLDVLTITDEIRRQNHIVFS